jgi:antitoxin (DNA-binding transcriptional repressor) of toxin-antitoxin stability system
MSVQMLNIHEAKTKLSAVLMQIEKTGEHFVICRNGTPIAEIGPLKKRQGSRLGVHAMLSDMQINYDPTEDLTEEEWGKIE